MQYLVAGVCSIHMLVTLADNGWELDALGLVRDARTIEILKEHIGDQSII